LDGQIGTRAQRSRDKVRGFYGFRSVLPQILGAWKNMAGITEMSVFVEAPSGAIDGNRLFVQDGASNM